VVAVGGEGVHPAPQKFTTFNTFTTFAKFAKFAKFANFKSALEHSTLIRRHAPRLGSLAERASRRHTPSPVSDGPGTRAGAPSGPGE
jgi:hypothetical protein